MGLPHAPLYSKYTDLTIRVSDLGAIKEGPSASATAALSLVAMLGGRLVSKNVVVTGTIDLSGNMLPVGQANMKTVLKVLLQTPGIHQLFVCHPSGA